MGLLRLWTVALFAAAGFLISAPATAAVKDAVLNKEGVWALDADGDACALSRALPDGSTFLFRAQGGDLTFGYFPKARMKAGRTARFELGPLGFDFRPSFGDGGDSLYLNDTLDPQIVTALRTARELRVLIDGRPVVFTTLASTGFPEALDSVIACSNGQEGWWGKGAQAEAAQSAPATPKLVMNKEDVWGIAVSKAPALCYAQATVDEHIIVQFLAADGRRGLAVSSDRRLPAGKRGRLETDAAAFEFGVTLEKDRTYLTSDEPFSSAQVALLQNAKWIRFSLERRQLLDIEVSDTGLSEALDAVAACSRSEAGWWGPGARPRG